MFTKMPLSLLDKWIQENNAIVNKWKQHLHDRGDTTISRDHDQTLLKHCHVESHKLLQKIQGVPAVTDHVQLELTVVYNSCVFCLSQTQLSEAEQTLTQGLERALGVMGCKPLAEADPPVFWRNILECLGSSAVRSSLLQLLCLNWALWLSDCRLKTIRDLQEELNSLSEGLGAGEGDERRSAGTRNSSENSAARRPVVVLDPRELRALLQICTVIAQGAEWLGEGRWSEALCVLQTGPSMPAPRALLAHTHFLSGVCLARMGRPQSALQCFRKAMEADSGCACALHQSTLVYRELGNTQAEIPALSLLHSMLMLPPTASGSPLLHPDSLLRGQSLGSLLSVPSPLSVLHSLALKCVLRGRVSEGVEHYLDLLAALQSDDQHAASPPNHVRAVEGPPLPRLSELYLETGSALLAARRPADCSALCDEVISTTLELLPQKLIVEEEWLEGSEAGLGSPDGPGSAQGRLATVLWAGAAHLLQAHCQAHLKDWKQAVTHYTRCINLLVKVCIQPKGLPQAPGVDMAAGGHRFTLQRLKGLALAGRGISFTQRDQLREALRDLQLSLQASPGCMSAGLWQGEVLWRLGRKQEAACCWEKAWSSSKEATSEGLPLYLQDPQTCPSLDPADLCRRLEDFTHTRSALGGIS